MRLTVLSSGSGGNCLLLESGGARILIDAGVRSKRLKPRLRHAGTAGGAPADAAFLTHEHQDHVVGADDLAAQGVRLFATAGTARTARLSEQSRAQLTRIAAGAEVRYGPFTVRGVALPHDATEPVGYVISDGQVRVGVLTDCGHPAREVAHGFLGCDGLVLETNHDGELLRAGPYPPRLKARIGSDLGHLSNEQSALLLREIVRLSAALPRLIVCAHLSKTNNRPELARAAIVHALGRHQVPIHVADQDRALGPLDILAAAGQLSLPLG